MDILASILAAEVAAVILVILILVFLWLDKARRWGQVEESHLQRNHISLPISQGVSLTATLYIYGGVPLNQIYVRSNDAVLILFPKSRFSGILNQFAVGICMGGIPVIVCNCFTDIFLDEPSHFSSLVEKCYEHGLAKISSLMVIPCFNVLECLVRSPKALVNFPINSLVFLSPLPPFPPTIQMEQLYSTLKVKTDKLFLIGTEPKITKQTQRIESFGDQYKIPAQNIALFPRGGPDFRGQEPVVVARILQWIYHENNRDQQIIDQPRSSVVLDWINAGYYPEWFQRVIRGTDLFGLIVLISGFVLGFWKTDLSWSIFCGAILLFESWILFVVIVNRIIQRWIPISAPHCTEKPFHLPTGGVLTLEGMEYLPMIQESGRNPKPLPVAIVLHGYNSRRGQLNYISLALTQLGIATISYDQRGHGQSGGDKNDILFVMRDLNWVLEYIAGNPLYDASRVAVIGVSMGAIIALYEGYLDPRVKHVIGLAAAAEYREMISENIKPLSLKWFWVAQQRARGLEVQPTPLQSRLVSPIMVANHRKGFFDAPVPWEVDNNTRVLLLHCADDYVIPPQNFERNIETLGLNAENTAFFARGSHWFTRQEVAVVGKIAGWLYSKGYLG